MLLNLILDQTSPNLYLFYQIMNTATQIIKGHVNELFKLNEQLSKNRLEICYRCPLFRNVLGGICNNKLWLNVNTGDVSPVEKAGYKRGCGCLLKNKALAPGAKCPVGKW